MADRQPELHEMLCEILGSREVYFQPPESVKMKYPAIEYSLDDIYTTKADNKTYKNTRRYQITLMDPDPNSTVIDDLISLPMTQFNRYYASDNLNHWIFVMYF